MELMTAAEARAKLAMLREEFAHCDDVQDWLADWWGRLRIDDRRLLLALCGMDDSEENARRAWRLHLTEQRDKLLRECRRLGRLLEMLKWA